MYHIVAQRYGSCDKTAVIGSHKLKADSSQVAY